MAGCVQVYLQKGRLLLALQAVKQALRLVGPDSAEVHPLVIRFIRALEPAAPAIPNGKIAVRQLLAVCPVLFMSRVIASACGKP
jgi:hypothetical protein